MTYLALYLTPSFLIALHCARLCWRDWRERRKRVDEVRDLEWLFDMEAREPERRVS